MTAVGISGHQKMPDAAATFVRESLVQLLPQGQGLVGYSSLAAGADQIFAEYILGLGEQLHVVLPCANYESSFDSADDRLKYQSLLGKASAVEVLPFARPSEGAYLAAGKAIVDACDVLIAVWDGRPAQGIGGTADIVAYAEHLGRPVEVVWPPGVSR